MGPVGTRTAELSLSLQQQRWILLYTSENWKYNPGPTAGWINCPKKPWPKQAVQRSLLLYPLWTRSTSERALPTGRDSWCFSYKANLWTIREKGPTCTPPHFWGRYLWFPHLSSPPGEAIRNRDTEHRSALSFLWNASWPPATQTLTGQTISAGRRLWFCTGWEDCWKGEKQRYNLSSEITKQQLPLPKDHGVLSSPLPWKPPIQRQFPCRKVPGRFPPFASWWKNRSYPTGLAEPYIYLLSVTGLQKKPKIEKPNKIAPKEKSKSPWRLPIGTFRKLLFIRHPGRFQIRLNKTTDEERLILKRTNPEVTPKVKS